MTKLLAYEEKDTWIHWLSGITKFLFFLLWCITSALTYDTRVLITMIVITLAIFAISKTSWKQVRSVFLVVLLFMVLNVIAIFLLSPYQGCEIYGSTTVLTPFFKGHDITAEELFYLFNIVIKYFTITPAVFVFMVTTDPSEFAASMNKAGVPYQGAYAVSIALRYIPDVQSDFVRIRNAQEARGIEMSAKAGILDRIKRTSSILFPLLFSSMERIDVVSNAMELRGFGKKKKRTWYSYKKLRRNDYIVLVLTIFFCVAALVLTYYDGDRFFNPFR